MAQFVSEGETTGGRAHAGEVGDNQWGVVIPCREPANVITANLQDEDEDATLLQGFTPGAECISVVIPMGLLGVADAEPLADPLGDLVWVVLQRGKGNV